MSSRRSFLAWLPAFLGGVAAVPRLMEAAESAPPPLPTTARERSTRAFVNRLDACCRQQGKTLGDVAREVGDVMGRRIRPERLIPMCLEDCESTSWMYVMRVVAIYVLDVNVGWLAFGEETPTHPAPAWWRGTIRAVTDRSPLRLVP